MDDVAIEAVKSAVEGLWNKTPQSYMPVVLMAVLFIAVLAVISWMQHKHMERMYEKNLDAIRNAYKDTMNAQLLTIKELTKVLDRHSKK